VSNLTLEIVVGVIVALALFGVFLRRVSQEQGSVEGLSRKMESMDRQQRLKEAAALKELKKSGKP
jgi:hypothetical protein